MKTRILTIMIISALAACTPQNRPDGSAPAGGDQQSAATSGSVGTAGAQVGAIGDGTIKDGMMLEGKNYAVSYQKGAISDPNNVLSQQTIYFDYDSSEIKPEYVKLVEHHGKYKALHSDVKIRLEGHTDERGTREYNIALADRRAQAVKRMLTFQGASSDQVTIISYGEEKPAVFGQDEESWSLNRRAEIVYLN